MPQTIGYHVVISGYGLWLPGDSRGHWSTQWDEQLGLIQPHKLHEGDPVRLRMSAERMKHSPVHLSLQMITVVIAALERCVERSDWNVVAASVEATHTHLLLTYTPCDIDNTVKWLKDQTTKALHRQTPHTGPVWCEGSWRSYVFANDVWQNTQRYVERHNERRGIGPRPYPFIKPGPLVPPR